MIQPSRCHPYPSSLGSQAWWWNCWGAPAFCVNTLLSSPHKHTQGCIRGTHQGQLKTVFFFLQEMPRQCQSVCFISNGRNVTLLLETPCARRHVCRLVAESRAVVCAPPAPQPRLTCPQNVNLCEVSYGHVHTGPLWLFLTNVTQTTCLERNQGKYISPKGKK